jgi:hypothetical protein
MLAQIHANINDCKITEFPNQLLMSLKIMSTARNWMLSQQKWARHEFIARFLMWKIRVPIIGLTLKLQ